VGGKRAGLRQIGTTGKSGAAPKIVSSAEQLLHRSSSGARALRQN